MAVHDVMVTLMNALPPASAGIFSLRDAAKLTHVPSNQIRGWLQGYRQRKGHAPAEPILKRTYEPIAGELTLGFLELLEVEFLGRLAQACERVGRRPSWRALRAAAVTARRRFGTDHPFALKRIYSDGKSVILEAKTETEDQAFYDLSADNFAIYDILARSFIASVDFEGDEPRRWTPDTRFPHIVVDPRRSFGRPIEVNSGVPAETLFDAWRAEKQNAGAVARWFETDQKGVMEAVYFWLGMALPAAA